MEAAIRQGHVGDAVTELGTRLSAAQAALTSAIRAELGEQPSLVPAQSFTESPVT
jgi:hypothetical protein